MGPRQVPAASHKATILQLDDKTIDNTASRADHPSISFWSFTNAFNFIKRILNLLSDIQIIYFMWKIQWCWLYLRLTP